MDQNQQQPPPPQYYSQLQYQTPPPNPGGGKAIASMVLGILALTIGWCTFIIAVPMAVVGLILGILDRAGPNRGMAKAGIIMNSIALALNVIMVVVVIVLIAMDALK